MERKYVRSLNLNLIGGWLFMVIALVLAYCCEVLKGERTWVYVGVFALVSVTPAVIGFFFYRIWPEAEWFRYYVVAGFFVMYLYSMTTGKTIMVFCYILPMLSFLILYHQPKLIAITGVIAFVTNVIMLAIRMYNGKITLANSRDAEIQMALIVICFIGSYVATKLYDRIMKENISYMQMLDEKNQEIREMSLRTISTISNAIDAKDEYTQGHSERVAMYSSKIAEKIGFTEEQIKNIHTVALLHDIGKIGVSDYVLNKPGKLTEEEYAQMKQHTVMGSKILEDIYTMIPEIGIGARSHHERYDGMGYPDRLKGEEIPLIARIIAVADAYDAMTSDRVYRKRLSEDIVMEELRKGDGKQFDPVAVRALIDLIENGDLKKEL